VFEAFQQGDASLTRRFGGLGLGLTITRALVKAHGGSVHATSEGKGMGATFTIDLPTVAAADSTARAEPEPEPAAAHPNHTPLRILLVEDHVDTLTAMARLLDAMGHHVTTAATAKDALRLAEQDQIDLVISDLALPDGSG